MEQQRVTASDQPSMKNHHQNQSQTPNNNRRPMKPQESSNHIQPPPPQKCPRCDSANTKFCYYNNYSLSQPRYFCKACRRYWTHGGTLRNVPVGGGCRKSKRPKSSSSSTPSNNDQISRSSAHAQSLAVNSSLSSSTPTPAFSSQSFAGLLGTRQNLIRATNPLTMGTADTMINMPNPYTTSSSGGVFFSSLGTMFQPLPQQGGFLSGGNSTQFGAVGNMAFLQGMNFQNLMKPQVTTPMQQIITPDHQGQNDNQLVGSSQIQQKPTGSWTEGIISNTTGATTTGTSTPSTCYWSGSSANIGDHGANVQAGASSFNPNQWSDSNNNHNQGFDPSR